MVWDKVSWKIYVFFGGTQDSDLQIYPETKQPGIPKRKDDIPKMEAGSFKLCELFSQLWVDWFHPQFDHSFLTYVYLNVVDQLIVEEVAGFCVIIQDFR